MSQNAVASLKVRLGAHNLQNSADETGVQDIGVKLVAKHKDFEWETGHSDIAILVLKSPIKYTNTVRPVCLPAGKASYAGEKGTVAGWGLHPARSDRKYQTEMYANMVYIFENYIQVATFWCKN